MKDSQKLILNVGGYNNIELINRYLKTSGEDRISFSEKVLDVTEAMDKINNGNYFGVLMSSLVLSLGLEHEKYSIEAKKFNRFDHPPNICRSGGLYVVEQACNKGLVTVVNAIAENDEEISETKQLGAECFKGFDNLPAKNLKYFRSRL